MDKIDKSTLNAALAKFDEAEEAEEMKKRTEQALELSVRLSDGTKLSPRVSFLDPDQPMEIVIAPAEGDPIVISPPLDLKLTIAALMLYDQVGAARQLAKAKASDVMQVQTPQGPVRAKVGAVRPQMLQQLAQTIQYNFGVGEMVAEEVVKEWMK